MKELASVSPSMADTSSSASVGSNFRSITRRKEAKIAETVRDDKISTLPDETLCHILSFLPTKDAVRTTILSKRWSRVWTSVPNIEISDRSSLSAYFSRRYTPEEIICFVDFVGRVLHLNKVSCLRRFCIHCLENYDLPILIEWINSVINRDVEELHLDFNEEQDFNSNYLGKQHVVEFPLNVHTSKNLAVLKLRNWGNIIFIVPTLVYLPNVKILHFHCIHFFDENTLINLLAGCPILEELVIEIDSDDDIKTFFIRSSSLKRLKVHAESLCGYEIRSRIVVDAENLEHLDLKVDTIIEYDLNNLSSLVKLDLDLCGGCSGTPDCYDVYDPSIIVELLNKMSNTKHLSLSLEFLRCLDFAQLNDLPVFHNLTHLEMKTFVDRWTVLPFLLECSPNLISFVLNKVSEFRLPIFGEPRRTHFQAPKCLMLKLEEIKLTGFKGSTDEMKMVRYFLKSAIALKKISIQCHYSGSKTQAKILKELVMFQRGSNECEIIFN